MGSMAIKVQLPDAQTLNAILHGLDQTLLPLILQHQPKSLADQEKNAMTLQASYNNTSPGGDQALLQAMAEMSLEMNNMNAKLKCVAFPDNDRSRSPYSPTSPFRSGHRDRTRTPSPHWRKDWQKTVQEIW